MSRISRLVAFCFCLVTAFAANSQTSPPDQQKPPGQEEVVRVTTNLVQVDAVVTDKSGKQVTDLRPEDFEIVEDGHPREITNFSYITLGSTKGLLHYLARIS